MKTGLIVPLVVIGLFCGSVLGADSLFVGGLDGLNPQQVTPTYPVVLALSGGGARGLASIGILQAFEQKGIVVTGLAGTSIGGIVGGLYACGYSADQLKSIIDATDFNELFASKPARLSMFLTQRQERDRHLVMVRFDGFHPRIPQGLTAGQQLISMLNNLTSRASYNAGGDFSHLKIPFRAVTTDVVSGRMVVLADGSLADAMRATMAFPLAFTGVEHGEELLMDGGMVAPIPVAVAKSLGDSGSFVVAINSTSPLVGRAKLQTPLDIANQVTSIMTADQLTNELKQADFVITPDLHTYTAADFDEKDSLIELGYRLGLRAADSIIGILARRGESEHLVISQVTCPETDTISEFAIRTRLAGKQFTRTELRATLIGLARDLDLFDLRARWQPCGIAATETPGDPQFCITVTAHKPLLRNRTRFVFSGVTRYTDDSLVSLMDLPDSIITPAALRRGLDRIVNLYRVDGYDLADVRDVQIDFKQNTISIKFDEAVIRRIDVERNRRTRDWLVRSYTSLQVGQPYSTRRADAGATNLYGTDLFERVSVAPRREHDSAIAEIVVEERPSAQVRLGWHWDDEFKSEQFVEVLNDNLLGIGLEYLLHAQYSNERQSYFGELKANRIFKTYLTGHVQGYHDRLDRPLYDLSDSSVGVRSEYRTGGFVTVGQQIARLGTLSGGLRIEHIQFHDSRDNIKHHLNLSVLSFQSLVETFNRWPYPATGKKHLLELDFAGKAFGGQSEYTRFFTSLEAYFPIGPVVNYHPKLTLGLSRNDLPPTEKFYMGGQQMFAGLQMFQRSGDKILLMNHELRFRLPFRFFAIARYDIGEVYAQLDQIKLRNLHHGLAVTLAYDSFLGPVELTYGVSDGDHDRVYFGAGLSF